MTSARSPCALDEYSRGKDTGSQCLQWKIPLAAFAKDRLFNEVFIDPGPHAQVDGSRYCVAVGTLQATNAPRGRCNRQLVGRGSDGVGPQLASDDRPVEAAVARAISSKLLAN